jgi:hypothetical protein
MIGSKWNGKWRSFERIGTAEAFRSPREIGLRKPPPIKARLKNPQIAQITQIK